jgi:hypothetical protein
MGFKLATRRIPSLSRPFRTLATEQMERIAPVASLSRGRANGLNEPSISGERRDRRAGSRGVFPRRARKLTLLALARLAEEMKLEPGVPPVLVIGREKVPELPPDEMDEKPAGVSLADAPGVLGRRDEEQPLTLTARDELRFDRFAVKLKKPSGIAKVARHDISESRRGGFPSPLFRFLLRDAITRRSAESGFLVLRFSVGEFLV